MIYQSTPAIHQLARGKYKGYVYVVYSMGTHPTAYISVKKGSPFYGQSTWDLNDSALTQNVRQELTYSKPWLPGEKKTQESTGKDKKWWIGWDYAHEGDYNGFIEQYPDDIRDRWLELFPRKYTTPEILDDVKDVIDAIS